MLQRAQMRDMSDIKHPAVIAASYDAKRSSRYDGIDQYLGRSRRGGTTA
jgi:hypothetical protein